MYVCMYVYVRVCAQHAHMLLLCLRCCAARRAGCGAELGSSAISAGGSSKELTWIEVRFTWGLGFRV